MYENKIKRTENVNKQTENAWKPQQHSTWFATNLKQNQIIIIIIMILVLLVLPRGHCTLSPPTRYDWVELQGKYCVFL